MSAILEFEEQKAAGSEFGFTIDVGPDSNCGLFRRYHISEDPIGFAGGDVNYYARVGNNPVNFIDPMGLYSLDELMRDAGNFSAGFGDTITSLFGTAHLVGLPSLTEYARQQAGAGGVVNKCAGLYKGGKVAGDVWGVAFSGAAAARAAGWT